MAKIEYLDSKLIKPYVHNPDSDFFPRYSNFILSHDNDKIMAMPRFEQCVSFINAGVANNGVVGLLVADAVSYNVVGEIVVYSLNAGWFRVNNNVGNAMAYHWSTITVPAVFNFGLWGTGCHFDNAPVNIVNETGAVTDCRGYIRYSKVTK